MNAITIENVTRFKACFSANPEESVAELVKAGLDRPTAEKIAAEILSATPEALVDHAKHAVSVFPQLADEMKKTSRLTLDAADTAGLAAGNRAVVGGWLAGAVVGAVALVLAAPVVVAVAAGSVVAVGVGVAMSD